jgi:hypothetical protein
MFEIVTHHREVAETTLNHERAVFIAVVVSLKNGFHMPGSFRHSGYADQIHE